MITGGAGYIGNELVYRLSAEPAIEDILVYDNLCKGNYNLFTACARCRATTCALSRPTSSTRAACAAAWRAWTWSFTWPRRSRRPFADQNAHDFEQTNHWGTAEVVYTAEEVGIGRLIYLSSQAVYGQGESATRSIPRVPSSYYGMSKMRGEEHVLRLMEKLPVQVCAAPTSTATRRTCASRPWSTSSSSTRTSPIASPFTANRGTR
jgi:UDP-glucose 4-epimerase